MNLSFTKLCKLFLTGLTLTLFLFSAVSTVEAQLFNSSSYQIIQPIVNTSQTGTSTSFQVTSSISQINVSPTNLNGPTITGVHAPVVGPTSAEVKWTTNIVASSTLNWGTTSGVFTSATSSSAMTIEHALKMSDLSANTAYYYKVTSYDALGNASTSDNGGGGYTFTTPSSGETITIRGGTQTIYQVIGDDSTPIISTINVKDISSNSATVSFKVSKLASGRVAIGVGSVAGGVTVGSEEIYRKNHSVPLTGLSPGTEYLESKCLTRSDIPINPTI